MDKFVAFDDKLLKLDKKALKDPTESPEVRVIKKPPVQEYQGNSYGEFRNLNDLLRAPLNELIEVQGLIATIPIIVLTSDSIFISKRSIKTCIVHGERTVDNIHVDLHGRNTKEEISRLNNQYVDKGEGQIEVFISCDGMQGDEDGSYLPDIDNLRWDQSDETVIGFSQNYNFVEILPNIQKLFPGQDEVLQQIRSLLGDDDLFTSLLSTPLLYTDEAFTSKTVNPFVDEKRAKSSFITDRFIQIPVEFA